MPLTNRLLASTALIFSMATGPLHAANLRPVVPAAPYSGLPVIEVQMSLTDARARLEAAMAALAEAQANGGDVDAAKAAVADAQAELDAAMAAEATPAEPAPEPVQEPAPEPAPSEATTTEPAPAEPAPAEPAPAEPAPAEPAPVEEPQAEAPAPASGEPSAQSQEPVEEVIEETPAEPAPETGAEDKAPVTDTAPAADETPEKPATEAPGTNAAETGEQPVGEQPATDNTGGEAPPASAPEQAPTPEQKPAQTGEAPPPAEEKSAAEQDAEAEATARATAESDTVVTPEATLPVEGGAPVLDSAKESPAPTETDNAAPGKAGRSARTQAAEAPPAPKTDAEAQPEAVRAAEIPPSLAEEGQRLQAEPVRNRQQRAEEGKVVRESENRFVIQFNNQIIIENNDRERLRQRADEVYYDELPRGRTREVIVRRNGVRIITVRDRYGEIIRRSKIMPDGREILLAYVPENYRDDRRPWDDPGRDLPPLRLTIPIGEYVLDATVARPDQWRDFLERPPVERVERIYTVDEVKHSARIRDKVRRIDMDTLTFEFGSARIARDQIDELGNLADAIEEILAENPGETILIEGHTDAVGSDADNLILSDERAEAVAIALTSVYGIPPENLVTQGYGERYLKIRTQGPERLNRRVTIRRITPLVAPLAAR